MESKSTEGETVIQDISLLAAFVAGTLSITSPCVLPLIPIYLAHLAGVAISTGGIANRPG